MHLRRSAALKYFIAALVGAALYCEWFVYILQPAYWQELKCQEEGLCTKILFIADPQIQGDLAAPAPLNYLFNWDSDRYLKSTFSVVTKYFKPDVLVYLGDLMDEGSKATIKQYNNYVTRLSNIFELKYPVENVWIPGDNDIGGENEPIKKDKVEKFESVFMQPSIVTIRNISFYKVNAITNHYPKLKENNTDYKIVVSHYPITIRYVFGHQVNDEIHPNVYFCAHSHESKYAKLNKDLSNREIHWMTSWKEILNILADEQSLYEVYVPTCSYRMGTTSIGFGAAVLENNNIRYTVFWSPQRFIYLYFYLAILIITSLVFCCTRLLHISYWWVMSSATSKDKVPLLGRI